jgi:hypothetical protein
MQQVLKESLSTRPEFNSFEAHHNEQRISHIAGVLAGFFRQVLADKQGKADDDELKPIGQYLAVNSVRIIELHENEPRGRLNRYLNMEMACEKPFEKFNTNTGYSSPDSELAQAFSHYTWSVSHGRVLVCDLQGWKTDKGYLLTDPAIHTSDTSYLPVPTNLHLEGMIYFFQGHKCGATCQLLDLKMPTPLATAGRGA